MVLKISTKTALGATAIFGTIAAFGYMYYTGKLNHLFETHNVEGSFEKKKKKKKPSSSSVSVEEIHDSSPQVVSNSSTQPLSGNSFNPVVANTKSQKIESKSTLTKKSTRLIDLPVEEIMKLPPEQREQVFYAILIEGENLLNKGNSHFHHSL
jgi:hypothetical protein